MEQLTEFVGKSFVNNSTMAATPSASSIMINLEQQQQQPEDDQEVAEEEDDEVEIKPRPTTKVAAAHMISNLLSTRLPPIVNAHHHHHHHRPASWSLYPFSLFAAASNSNATNTTTSPTEPEVTLGQYYHPKLTLNSMVERFNEFKHQMSHQQQQQQQQHHLHQLPLPPHPHQMLEEVYKHSMFPFLHANSLVMAKEATEPIGGISLAIDPDHHEHLLRSIDIETNSISSEGKCLRQIVS